MRVRMLDHSDAGVLATREAGARARFAIERQIAAAGADTPICLDFAEVRAITVPFTYECIGGLLAGRLTGYYEEHPLIAVNTNEDVRETLAVALAARRLALLSVGPDRPELLGGDRTLAETLREAAFLGEFSAADLAERLNISPQAANNRLKALVDRGALRRVRLVPRGGGKEFAYEVPTPGPENGLAVGQHSATTHNGRRDRAKPRAGSHVKRTVAG